MVCRKVHVARPRPSTSGGQSAGRVSASAVAATVVAAAVPVATAFLVLEVCGFQFRNVVQILHGFPSGPMTIPGGSGSLLEVSDMGWLGSPIMLVGGRERLYQHLRRIITLALVGSVLAGTWFFGCFILSSLVYSLYSTLDLPWMKMRILECPRLSVVMVPFGAFYSSRRSTMVDVDNLATTQGPQPIRMYYQVSF